jgi:large repetitive protein
VSFELSLVDLVSPYVLQGDTFGAWHAVLSILRVAEHETAVDENGMTIRGVVEFEGNLTLDPMNMSIAGSNVENHPQNDASRRDPWIDIRDAKLDFQLVVPRVAAQKVSTAVAAIGGGGSFANSAAVITAYDNNPNDAPPSDYPTTGFTLDLLLTTVVLRPPFLRGAKREPNGQLVADPQHEQVSFTLPRLKFRLFQGPLNGDPIVAGLLSAGATGLDDPGDIAVAELIKMEPPYAFIGPSQVVGFGFRSGVLDLSEGSTPPDVLAQFGFDESWTGLYLPEIRLFIAPNGAQDFAIDAGVENLLIGIGASSGITGDFSLQVLDQGAGPLKLGARFYDADQRGYGLVRTSETTGTVSLPERSRMVVDVEGGRTPMTTSVTVQGNPAQNNRVVDIDLSSAAERTITINVTDTSSPQRTGTLTIAATRRPAPIIIPGVTSLGPVPAAVLTTTSITQGTASPQQPRLILVAETPSTATIALDLPPARQAQTQWTIDGTPRGTSATLTVDLPPGTDAAIRAELPGEAAVNNFTGYFRFDQPPYRVGDRVQTDDDTRNFARQPDNTHTTEAGDEGTTASWLGGSEVRSALLPLLQGLPTGTAITVEGFASYEGPPPPNTDNSKRTYNEDLSRRRALGLRTVIEDLIAVPSNGLQGRNLTVSHAPNMTNWQNQGFPQVETRRIWWKAVAKWNNNSSPDGIVVQGTLHRDAQTSSTTDPVIVDPPPPENQQPPPPPRWFRQMGGKVRIVRNQFVACEVTAKIDVQTAAEDRLQGSMPPGQSGTLPAGEPLGANPADGLIDFRLVIQIDDATDTVSIIGYYGADPADIDGLWLLGTRPGQPPAANPGFGLNFLGTTIAFMPLIDAGVGAVANEGALAELGMTAAMLAIPATIAGFAAINNSPVKMLCEWVTWYGGEVQFRSRPTGQECVILFDLEAALSLDVAVGSKTLLKIDRRAPMRLRYKAVGVRIGDNPALGRFQFKPVFDASKGYTIDVSRPGAITVASPLDEILTVLGARIARNNPLVFEIDLGFAVDLGVVAIERARVRLKFDPVSPPELTAFAASVDIPAALRGRGYLEMNENEIKGQLDLTIVPVQVRIAAGVGVANINENGRKATGVIVTLEVEFPVAIPLGSSGLGIYGFLGLFAMHYTRKEPPPGSMAPALAWLKNVAQGNPANIAAWTPKIDTWAFGVGAILGTMGSSIIFNLKGVVLLELPGPRLLLMMRANLLAVMPQLEGTAEGTFLAVIDLDMGRGTLTIGISIDFGIRPLLEIQIPVEAFFNFNNRKDWHLYLGRYVDQIHAKIFEVFEGSGYLMLSGKGFVAGDLNSNLPVPVKGFAIATGLHVSFIWGSKSIGLYAELAAGFDAVLGFDPFRLTGILYVRGTLHLFIIDISAWANLTVDIGELPDGSRVARVSGEI